MQFGKSSEHRSWRYSEEEAARGAEEWFHSGLGFPEASARIEAQAAARARSQAQAVAPSAPSAFSPGPGERCQGVFEVS